MIKIIATRCYILKLQFVRCTKFDFGKGSTLDPTGGAHNAFPDSLAGFKESYFKGKENGKRKKRERKRERKGVREGENARGISRPHWLKPRSAIGFPCGVLKIIQRLSHV